jgi:uncharacterized protein YfaS (alpha-2-macroglobulin family)
MAQNYEKEWKIIDSLEAKGLPESALKETESLLAKIRKDSGNKNQAALLIKVLVYANKFQIQSEEDGLEKAIYRFQTETEKMSEGPIKAIMQSMLAEMYSNYLENHIYKIKDRTTLADNKSDDISTWDINSITEKVFELYSKSIKNPGIKSVKLADYKDLLLGDYDVILEPSLFDFLINRAIGFYSNENSYLSKPAYRFYIDQPEALADEKTFTAFRFTAKDSLSEKFRCLLMFQELIAFHAKDESPEALVDANLRRLKWVHQHAIIANKDELYIKSLSEIAAKFEKNNAAAEALYYIAAWHEAEGLKYNPSPEQTYRWDYKKAVTLASEIIKKYPDSYGARHAQSLMMRLKERSLGLSVENVYPIDKVMLVNLSYRNLKKGNFRLIKLSDAQIRELSALYQQDKIVSYLNKLKVDKQWSVDLIDEGDFQTHSVDISVPACKNGIWMLMVSEKEDFSYNKNGISYSIFNVSDLSYFYRQMDGKYEFTLTDRNSGVPLENVKAEFYINKYNSLLRRYEDRKIYEAFSNKNGNIVTTEFNRENYYSYYVKFSRNGDELYLKNSYYNYSNNKTEVEKTEVHFFTDRAIYRPGQTVYFKGIVISSVNGKNPKIQSGYATDVIFNDANYQQLAKKSLVSNEFGSFEGSFTAPSSGMTGRMQIVETVNYSSHSIIVEEYKRPKFEVGFEPMKEAFKLDETVTVKGFGKAYAGSNIDGAKVQYRVVREVNFPLWRWYWGWNPWEREEQEIAFGETTSNEKGEFKVSFKAIPDKSVPAAQKPQFTYTVYADVTDISGETHSTETIITVGYVALNANVIIAESINREKTKDLELSTLNLNGEFEAAKGTVKIELLETPNIIYKGRLFGRADYYIIPEADFRRDFPNMAYKSEDEYYNWKSTKLVFETAFDSKSDKKLLLKDIEKWAQGKYKITLNTADKYGEKIEVVKFFSLYSEKESEVPDNEVIFVANLFPKAEPGEKVILDLGSFDTTANLLFEIEFDGQIIQSEWLKAPKRIKKEILIEEKYRGGISFHITAVLNNRFYKKQGTIAVPWTNKELQIEYSTFRDKLLPGQEEEWKIKISGAKKDKVAAEVLAGMYDASLDAFEENNWSLSLYSNNWARHSWLSNSFNAVNAKLIIGSAWNESFNHGSHNYATLNWFDMHFYDWGYRTVTHAMKGGVLRDADYSISGVPIAESMEEESKKEEYPSEGIKLILTDSTKIEKVKKAEENFGDVKVRSNLNETVFFFPKLMTDENGDVIIKFTMNEALTKWKFLWLAHTKDLKVGTGQKEIVTQKDLMVMPNAPRFFRQNDEIYFTAKVSNMTKEPMKGEAILQLFDALSMKPVDSEFANISVTQSFEALGTQSAPLVWKLKVPDNWTNAITYRVIAKSGTFSDGEENSLPVLSNRMLLTETMPLPIRGGQTKTFEFKRMAELSQSTTMRHHKYTLEFTPNPAWYAVQALPYIMEYPYECSEQLFSRFYANSIASSVANSHPKIKKVFDTWKNYQPDALKSNLTKNQELKYALLEETPWVFAAQNEEQQKRDLGILFDLNRMGNEMKVARDKLVDRQLPNGGFAWFPGGVDSWYITQYIAEGFGHLDVLGVKSISTDEKVADMVSKAVDYTDNRLAEYYEELLKIAKKATEGEKAYLEKDHLDYMAIHYLYTRSFYPNILVENKTAKKAIEYYEAQAAKYWLSKSDYMQGMLALALHRKGIDKITPQNIVKSLKERALKSEEMGMYWKYPSGYFWYEMPIETHCLLIEVFNVVAKDAEAVDNLKTYLLKSKQTTHWKTTKATASACYALLSSGDNWLMEDQEVKISIGNQPLDQSKINKEAGTGYFKTSWDASQIKNEMATVKVENPNKNVAWGAVYWQYFEQLDKVTDFKDTPLKITKKLFKEVLTDRGPVLQPINEQTKLLPGDLIKVRIELKVDRDMEYVHMKDMRASGFEPVNVLSQYKYQGGLGYYESTRDAATNFFFDYLSKGNYVFEYGLRVSHKGNFSNGVTTIQCMYAPEFTSHSEGVSVKVE